MLTAGTIVHFAVNFTGAALSCNYSAGYTPVPGGFPNHVDCMLGGYWDVTAFACQLTFCPGLPVKPPKGCVVAFPHSVAVVTPR